MIICHPIHQLENVSSLGEPNKLFESNLNPHLYNSTIDYKHVIVNDDGRFRIFMVGGTIDLINSVNQCYELIGTNQIKPVRNLIEPRHSFGCVTIKSSIVVIGGYFSHKTVLNSCEFYYAKCNRWVMFPPISEQRALVGACTFDDYIYCFGGVSQLSTKFFNVIERIDMSTVDYNNFDELKLLFELEWELVKLKAQEFDLCGFNYGCCQINTQEIIIFGGYIQDKEGVKIRGKLSRNTMIFNTKLSTIKHICGDNPVEESKAEDPNSNDLCIKYPDNFFYNDSILFRNKVYAIGKTNFNAFDLIKKTWILCSKYLVNVNSDDDEEDRERCNKHFTTNS